MYVDYRVPSPNCQVIPKQTESSINIKSRMLSEETLGGEPGSRYTNSHLRLIDPYLPIPRSRPGLPFDMYSLDRQHVYQTTGRVGRPDTYVADDTVPDGKYDPRLWYNDAQRIWLCRVYEGADLDSLFVGFIATHLDRLSLVSVSNQHAGF